ncbi:MAG: hypothetical protein OEL54_03865 [Flavobacteriaceae bacterium]|nr:hypothetical protein [Flavobacteriaceae bacterium]
MSILFFHEKLSKAKELIEKGDKRSLEEAKRIMLKHIGVVSSGETKEEKSFKDLLNATRNFMKHLEGAIDFLDSNKGFALEELEEAMSYGNLIVVYAKRMIRFVEEEERQAA